jgi:hypothetical protein
MARKYLHERRSAMTMERTPVQHIELERRKGFPLEGPAGTKIRVMHGEVWITRHHDARDYLLGAGEELEHNGKGTTLVTAIRDAGVQVLRPVGQPPAWSVLRSYIQGAPGDV